MKTFIITLLFSFWLIQELTGESILEGTEDYLTPIPPPPYYTNGTQTFYYYNPKISFAKLNTIMRQLTRYTCLTFKYSPIQVNNSIGINFMLSESGNNVSLSSSTEKPTNVSLEEWVYTDHKNLSFYIGLALGIIPEIRRPDRTKDIGLYMGNVSDSFMQFFKKTNLTDVPYINGTDFDFGSPMFFDPYFGSKNNQTTYYVKLYKNNQPSYGNGRIFRHNDYKHISYYYCNISESQNDCKNGGYKVKNSDYSSKCKCPEYFTNNTCTDLEPNTATSCTSERYLTANETKKYLILKNIEGSCHFNITAQNNDKKVKVFVEELEYENNNCRSLGPYVEILVRNDKGAKGLVLCRNSTNVTVPAISNEVIVVFYGDKMTNSLKLSYKEVPIEKRD